MKQGATSLFAKTKTEFARTKQKAMVKMGKADETVDINFANEKQRFLDTYKSVKKLNKDAQKLMDILKDLSTVQTSIAEDLYELYDNDAILYNVIIKNQETAQNFDKARIAMEDRMKSDFIQPISAHIGQYKDVKNRLKEEETRKVDMDRYSRDVRLTTEKAKTQGQLTSKEQKFETARINYQNLHDELLRDLPLLHKDRVPFLEPAIATYVLSVNDFYRSAATVVAEPTPLVAGVNPARIHDHPRITTPPAESYAGHKNTSAPTSEHVSPRNTPPVGSAVPPYANQQPMSHPPTQSSAYGPPSGISSTTGYVPVAAVPGPASAVPGPARAMPVPPARNRAPSLPNQIRAQALYDFVPAESNELGFKIGDIIVIHKQSGEWWEGEVGGRRGLLPSNYVKLL